MARACRICESPYRMEIEKLIKKKVMRSDIAEHYLKFFECDQEELYDSILRHENKKHPPLISQVPGLSIYKPTDEDVQEKEFPKTIEGYSQMLLEMGFTPEMVRKLTPKDIISAQKVLIEKEKAKNQANALKLTMAKLLSGLLKPGEVQEGEIVEQPEPPQLNEGAPQS